MKVAKAPSPEKQDAIQSVSITEAPLLSRLLEHRQQEIRSLQQVMVGQAIVQQQQQQQQEAISTAVRTLSAQRAAEQAVNEALALRELRALQTSLAVRQELEQRLLVLATTPPPLQLPPPVMSAAGSLPLPMHRESVLLNSLARQPVATSSETKEDNELIEFLRKTKH